MVTAKKVRVWYRLHKWSSLVCTVFLLLACITGLPLVFADELDAIVSHHWYVSSVESDIQNARIDPMLDAAKSRFPSLHIVAVSWDTNAPDISVYMSPLGKPKANALQTLIFDAHSGKLVNAAKEKFKLTTFLLRVHSQIFLGLPGELLMGVMGLFFAVSLISGALVYGPFMKRLPFGTYRSNAANRTRWFDLHNLLGIVTLTWAFVVGATGVINAVSTPLLGIWYFESLPKVVAPYRNMAVPEHLGSVDKAMRQVSLALPLMEPSAVLFPSEVFGSPRHYLILAKTKSVVHTQTYQPVFVDAETNSITIPNRFPWYLRMLNLLRPLHYGGFGGLPLKIIWALFDVALMLVLVSGVYLWISRRRTLIEHELNRLVNLEHGTTEVEAK